MRKYKVVLHTTDTPRDPQVLFHTVIISAEDFNTEQASDDKGIYFNFWVQPEGGDAYSVAAVPFENVLFIAVEP